MVRRLLTIQKGIIDKDGHHYCIQCSNEDHDYFSTYYSSYLKEEMIYCRRCIQLGRIDSVTEYRITESVQNISDGAYELPLRCQNNNNMHRNQLLMQSNIQRVSLLYAVTGAGKTEMMFEGIRLARQLGHNIAILSPRVDVVIEISQRIKDAFKMKRLIFFIRNVLKNIMVIL